MALNNYFHLDEKWVGKKITEGAVKVMGETADRLVKRDNREAREEEGEEAEEVLSLEARDQSVDDWLDEDVNNSASGEGKERGKTGWGSSRKGGEEQGVTGKTGGRAGKAAVLGDGPQSGTDRKKGSQSGAARKGGPQSGADQERGGDDQDSDEVLVEPSDWG
jgi:hypothetical protein